MNVAPGLEPFLVDVDSLSELPGNPRRGDEAIELHAPGSDRKPIYTSSVRKELILRTSNRYQRDWILVGKVSAVADGGAFEIRQPNGKTIQARGALDHFDSIKASLQPEGTGPLVRVEGVALLDAADTVMSMERVHSFEVAAPTSAGYGVAAERLDTLTALSDGWLDGSGSCPSLASIEAARNAMHLFDADEIPVPRIYPTLDGGVRLEWTIGDVDAALEAGATGALEIFVVGETSDDDAHHEHISASDAVFLLRDML